MKFSIITPSYNQAEFIERTIASVLEQDSANFEVEYVVFDGGSDDGTVEILKKYNDKLRWISKKDNGQTAAVNEGILATTGEIIGWLNSDDVYYPDSFKKVRNYFLEHPEVDVVYGKASHIDKNDKEFEAYPTEPWSFERLQFHCIVCQPALFFRRSVIDRFGLLDESLNYCMDYEYWLRLAKEGAKFAYLEEKLAGSRMYEDNKTLGARVRVHIEINNMFKQKFGLVPDRWLFNYAHAKTDEKFNKLTQPKIYTLVVSGTSLLAALKWNGKITKVMRSMVYDWIKTAFIKIQP